MRTEPDVSECVDCLCLASRRAARTITRAFDRRLRKHGLRATQFSILIVLMQGGPLTIGQLAEILGTERTTLSRNLGLIEAEGWVEIHPGKDARERLVTVTRKGRASVAAALPAWRKAQRAVTGAIGLAGSKALRALAQSPIN